MLVDEVVRQRTDTDSEEVYLSLHMCDAVPRPVYFKYLRRSSGGVTGT